MNIFNKELSKRLANNGISLQLFLHCPHLPEAECNCRKPKTGLLKQLEENLQVNLKGKYFIGDKESDIIAGNAHGCIPLLIQTGGYGEKVLDTKHCPPPKHCFDNLLEASKFIIK